MKCFDKFWFIALLGLLVVSCSEDQKVRVLPIMGHHDIHYKTVDGKEVVDSVYATIPAFSYLNQDSVLVTSESMKGKIWVADFFFTNCPTICPTMTTQLKRLQAMTKDLESEIQFISFSIDPRNDQPYQLRRFIKHHTITAKNWQFLTGDEAETHELGVNNFLVHAASDEESPGGFAHSDAFTLVDKEGIVRGVYIGTDTQQVNQLEKDLRKLLKYEYGIDGTN